MKRSELLYVMSLGRGNVPNTGLLDNRWYVHHGWSDAARAAALVSKRAKAASRKASSGGSGKKADPLPEFDPPTAFEDYFENGVEGMASGVADRLAEHLGGVGAIDRLDGAEKHFMEEYRNMKAGKGRRR